MNKEKVSIKVEGRSETVIFHLGTISVAENEAYMQRFTEIADLSSKEKADKEYDIYSDALASWSIEPPQKVNGTGKPEALGTGAAADVVKAYFGERTNAREWIAVTLVGAFRNTLYPKISFL